MAKHKAKSTENTVELASFIECYYSAAIRCDICRRREVMEADTQEAAKRQLLELVIEKGWRIIDNEIVCRPCSDIVRSADSINCRPNLCYNTLEEHHAY